MANYNTGRLYNFKVPDGGAVYNSAPYALIILDYTTGADIINSLATNITSNDSGTGMEIVTGNTTISMADASSGVDDTAVTAILSAITDVASGLDTTVRVYANVTTTDAGTSIEIAREAKAYFIITSDGILLPLGVVVLRDSREDIMPGIRSYTETIPGKYGEVHLKSDFTPRYLEIHVAAPNELSKSELEELKRNIAAKLNPLLGVKNLVFADDIKKTYQVKYSGRINLTRMLANWMEFTIPFKAGNPFIVGSFENIHAGSGTLTNDGNIETPLTIEISGPVTDPSVIVGDLTLTWTGTVEEGKTLVIDTEAMTVELDGVNVISTYTGSFPKLQPGNTTVTAASGGTTIFKWRDRWL